MSSEIGNSRIDHFRIGIPSVNKTIWSVDDDFSVQSDVGKGNKLDTSVQQSLTNKRNTAYTQIKDESLKSVFSKIVEESNLIKRMNPAISAIIEPPKLVSFRHPPMETDNVRNWIDGIVATIIENSDRIWRRTDRDDRTAHTHDDIETISKRIAYRKHNRDLEFETKEVLELETSNRNIENIETRLDKTRLNNNQMTRSADSSKHSEKHKPEVNPDPEPSSSNSLDSLSLDLRARKKKRTKKKKRRKHRKDDSSDPSLSDDSDSSDDSHYRRKRRKNKKHRKKYPIRLCATLTAKLLTTSYK